MTEIAQLFESALRQNRDSLLRKAAMNTVARMPAETTLRELLDSDAGEAVRALTLGELADALREAGYEPRSTRSMSSVSEVKTEGDDWQATREEQIFRSIVALITDDAMTIGQLTKELAIDPEELRGYLTWMKKMGKVTCSGRARATRYLAVT